MSLLLTRRNHGVSAVGMGEYPSRSSTCAPPPPPPGRPSTRSPAPPCSFVGKAAFHLQECAQVSRQALRTTCTARPSTTHFLGVVSELLDITRHPIPRCGRSSAQPCCVWICPNGSCPNEISLKLPDETVSQLPDAKRGPPAPCHFPPPSPSQSLLRRLRRPTAAPPTWTRAARWRGRASRSSSLRQVQSRSVDARCLAVSGY